MLQRSPAALAWSNDDMEVDDNASTSKYSPSPDRHRFIGSLVNPALSRPTPSSPSDGRIYRSATHDSSSVIAATTEATSRAEEQWFEYARLIQNLRKYVRGRLEIGEFEDEESMTTASPPHNNQAEKCDDTLDEG